MLGFLHAKNMTSVNSFENLHFSQFLGLHFELWMRSEFCVLKWLSDKITGKPGYMLRVNCIQEGTFRESKWFKPIGVEENVDT